MKSLGIKIGLVPAHRAVFSPELARKMRQATLRAFSQAGIQAVAPDERLCRHGLVESLEEGKKAAELFRREKVAGVVIGAMNFGNEIPAAEAADIGVPVFVFGCKEEGRLTPAANRRDAFCGTLSIGTALRHRGICYAFPQAPICFPDEKGFLRDLERFARACKVIAGLRGSSYGQIGPRPLEFETCVFNEVSLLKQFQVKVLPFPLAEIFAEALAIKDTARIKKVMAEICAMADTSLVPKKSVERLARLELALDLHVRKYHLQGLAVQCWTLIQEQFEVSPCTVMARFSQRGIPAACEVDIHGAMSMHLLGLASGNPAGLADWNNRHYKRRNVFSAWHCGVFPPGMAKAKPKMKTQKIIGQVTGEDRAMGTLEFEVKPGPVTLARLTETPEGEFKLLIAEGKVVKAEGETFGAHGWVEVSDLDCLYRALLSDFPHHTGIVMGHFGQALLEACKFLGITPVVPLELSA
ncbi:MAG: hypothetical protein A2V67_10005 [Deltaproteobacteria bacterium RBG_13_61_14]|nr:MAG: hypothetical protein A2V67_10005 [Deltaproteobacteria bacterium RBG_13_61_14]